jgi:hypothetical protein
MMPPDARGAEGAAMWGGVAGDTSGVDFEADCRAAQSAAMDGENRRRLLASESPGLGAQLPIAQPYADAGQGSPPVVGEGYSVEAPAAPSQLASYGPQRPVYGPDVVGGYGFTGGRSEPAVRHVWAVDDGQIMIGPYADGRQPVFVAPPAARKPSLWSKIRGRLRGRR